MLKLPARELPAVTFRADLPDYLAGGKSCFIEVDARAAGQINLAYAQALDRQQQRLRILAMQRDKLKGEPEAYVKAQDRDHEELGLMAVAAIYDACVIEWRSNILNDGQPITCDRETFLALAKVRDVPEISTALQDLRRQCIEAGNILKQHQDDTVKN